MQLIGGVKLPADLAEKLRIYSEDSGGIKVIPFQTCRKIASRTGTIKPRDVEVTALRQHLSFEVSAKYWYHRYQRPDKTTLVPGQR